MTVYTLTRVTTGAGGAQATGGNSYTGAFTPSGGGYVFGSDATNLVAGDTNAATDLFLKTFANGAVERVSTNSAGEQLVGGNSFSAGFLDANRFVFMSAATNAVAGDLNGGADIFLKNMVSGALTLVSANAGGTIGDGTSALADTSFGLVTAQNLVVFQSAATNLVAGDTNGTFDVFAKNVLTGAIQRVSTATGGGQSLGDSSGGRISPDGNLVVFQSASDDLIAGDTNATTDLFVKNLTTGVTTRISTSSLGAQSDGSSFEASFSPDSAKVIFSSLATNLVAGDTNGTQDVFIKDLVSGVTTRVSTDAAGAQVTAGAAGLASFSPDGSRVLFIASFPALVPGDTNAVGDAFIKTLATGAIERVSIRPDGVQSNNPAFAAGFSPDGTAVFFTSSATNLVNGDTNGREDGFLVSLVAPPPIVVPPPVDDDDGGLAPRGPGFDAIGASILRYLPPTLQPLTETVTTPTGQVLPNPLLVQKAAVAAMAPYDSGITSTQQAIDVIVDMADATTAVAVMNYQFFTGFIPNQQGLDFLVNSATNGADLNDGYYAAMAVENRFINFAVNLGKLGAGAAAFNAGYGALTLDAATSKAYAEIFGVTPSAAKVAAILTPARQAYLTALGGDAIGTKAAMVGYLLAEAAKSDLGTYAVMNENFLYDLADGVAAFGADAHIYLGAGPRSVSLIGLG